MGSLAVLLVSDAADRLGGAPEGVGVLAGVDGDRVDGDDLTGVDSAQGDLLPGDHDDAGVAGHPLGGDRLEGGTGRQLRHALGTQQALLRGGYRAPGDRPPAVLAVSRCRTRQYHDQALTHARCADGQKVSQPTDRNAAQCPG
jgi:hypothetical protein